MAGLEGPTFHPGAETVLAPLYHKLSPLVTRRGLVHASVALSPPTISINSVVERFLQRRSILLLSEDQSPDVEELTRRPE